MPSSIAAGDLLVIATSVCDNGALTTAMVGWNNLYTTVGGGDMRRADAWYKVAAGADTATLTATRTSAMAAVAFRITGYQATPEVGTSATGLSANPDPPTLTPSWGSANTLWIAVAHSQTTTPTPGYPSSYINELSADQVDAGNGPAHVSTARRELAATSDDPGTFTLTSGQWVANTIAIRPA